MNNDTYSFINCTIQHIPGFSGYEELLALHVSVKNTAELNGNIVEIGAWVGRSSVVLARAARNKRVFCVDLFPSIDDWHHNNDNTWSIKSGGHSAYSKEFRIWDQTFKTGFLPVYRQSKNIYDVFKLNTSEFENITPIVGTVNDIPDMPVSLAFIDGDHDYEAVRHDIRIIKSLLVPGGVICVDDLHFRSVEKAVLDEDINIDKVTRKLGISRY